MGRLRILCGWWPGGVAAGLVGGLPGLFLGVGLGRHEDSVGQVEDPPLGVRFEDVDRGFFWGGVSRMSHDVMASPNLEGWRCGVALRLRS